MSTCNELLRDAADEIERIQNALDEQVHLNKNLVKRISHLEKKLNRIRAEVRSRGYRI
jgi:predicted  nucleic acid-binding Zn-ribbon protein